eukprot:UN02755
MADDYTCQIKLVVVGDGAIGKTCLLIGYEKDEFPTDYVPTVFENVSLDKKIDVDGGCENISLDLWDTAGQEEFDRLRHLAYRETEVFMICFSVVEESSFHNLQSRWLPEVQHHSPDAVLLLVGLKCDLRDSETVGARAISPERIEEYRKASGAAAYVETSALKRINVDKAFNEAIQGAWRHFGESLTLIEHGTGGIEAYKIYGRGWTRNGKRREIDGNGYRIE